MGVVEGSWMGVYMGNGRENRSGVKGARKGRSSGEV